MTKDSRVIFAPVCKIYDKDSIRLFCEKCSYGYFNILFSSLGKNTIKCRKCSEPLEGL